MVRRGTKAKITNVHSNLRYVPPVYVAPHGSAAPLISSPTLKPCYRSWLLCKKVRIRHFALPQLWSLFGGVCNGKFNSCLHLSSAVQLYTAFKTLIPRSWTLSSQLPSLMIVCKTAGWAHRCSYCCFGPRPCFAFWYSMAQGSKSADQAWKLHNFTNREHLTPPGESLSWN